MVHITALFVHRALEGSGIAHTPQAFRQAVESGHVAMLVQNELVMFAPVE